MGLGQGLDKIGGLPRSPAPSLHRMGVPGAYRCADPEFKQGQAIRFPHPRTRESLRSTRVRKKKKKEKKATVSVPGSYAEWDETCSDHCLIQPS